MTLPSDSALLIGSLKELLALQDLELMFYDSSVRFTLNWDLGFAPVPAGSGLTLPLLCSLKMRLERWEMEVAYDLEEL